MRKIIAQIQLNLCGKSLKDTEIKLRRMVLGNLYYCQMILMIFSSAALDIQSQTAPSATDPVDNK